MRIIVVLLAALLLGACGSSGPEKASPQGAMKAFLGAVEDRDCEDMRAVVLTPSDFDCSSVNAYAGLFSGLDPGEAEITERSRAGSSAVVRVVWPSGKSDFEVEQVDGEWKIVLDTSA